MPPSWDHGIATVGQVSAALPEHTRCDPVVLYDRMAPAGLTAIAGYRSRPTNASPSDDLGCNRHLQSLCLIWALTFELSALGIWPTVLLPEQIPSGHVARSPAAFDRTAMLAGACTFFPVITETDWASFFPRPRGFPRSNAGPLPLVYFRHGVYKSVFTPIRYACYRPLFLPRPRGFYNASVPVPKRDTAAGTQPAGRHGDRLMFRWPIAISRTATRG